MVVATEHDNISLGVISKNLEKCISISGICFAITAVYFFFFFISPWGFRNIMFSFTCWQKMKNTCIHKLFKILLVCKYKHSDLCLTFVNTFEYLTKFYLNIMIHFRQLIYSTGIISNSLGSMWIKTALNVQLFFLISHFSSFWSQSVFNCEKDYLMIWIK